MSQPISPEDLLSYLPSHTTQEIRQEIYLALLESAPVNIEEVETIIRKVVNAARYKSRSTRRRVGPTDIETACHSTTNNYRTILSQILGLLDSSDRDLIQDRFLKGFSVAECAVKVGISQPTYRLHLAGALDRARAICAAHNIAFI